MEERALLDADPINPQRLFWELNDALPPDAIISADSGSSANWYARDVKLGRGQGVPVGNARDDGPRRPVRDRGEVRLPGPPAIALVGDGAMQMNGMAELITVAKYCQSGAIRGLSSSF